MDKSLEEAAIQLAEEGWKSIEIMCEGPHGELLEWSEERLGSLKRLGDSRAIAWTLHAPIAGCNPAARDAEERNASAKLLRRTLEAAGRLGCAHIVVHPGVRADVEGEGGEEEAALRIASFLSEALQSAEATNVAIALENVPPYPGLLGARTDFLLRVLEAASTPRLRIVYDIGHAHLSEPEEEIAALRLVLPHLASLHLSDNGGINDDHWRLGAGTAPLAETVAVLQAAGYSGSWVIEMREESDVEPSASWLVERSV
jgi:sugar phosphate isomerase/epimerase